MRRQRSASLQPSGASPPLTSDPKLPLGTITPSSSGRPSSSTSDDDAVTHAAAYAASLALASYPNSQLTTSTTDFPDSISNSASSNKSRGKSSLTTDSSTKLPRARTGATQPLPLDAARRRLAPDLRASTEGSTEDDNPQSQEPDNDNEPENENLEQNDAPAEEDSDWDSHSSEGENVLSTTPNKHTKPRNDEDDEDDDDYEDERDRVFAEEDEEPAPLPELPPDGPMSRLAQGQDASEGDQDTASKTAANSLASATRSTFRSIGLWAKHELTKRKFGVSGTVARRTMVRVQTRKKEVQELTRLRLAQRLAGVHQGPIWVMETSPNGHYLATGGKDGKVIVWQSLAFFPSSTTTSSTTTTPASTPATTPASLTKSDDATSTFQPPSSTNPDAAQSTTTTTEAIAGVVVTGPPLFRPKPLWTWKEHTGDVTSLAWSRSSILIATGSTDRTARLWSVREPHCLCIFQHADLVSAVDFDPHDESRLLTGCFDKRLRVWDIPTGAVVQRAATTSFITAAKFNLTGDVVVAGMYTGHCAFYQVAGSMRYYTQVECRNKAGAQKKGLKVTSVRFVAVDVEAFSTLASGAGPSLPKGEKGSPTPHTQRRVQEHMLVTTSDSKTRLYNMDDFSLVCKYRGASTASMMPIGTSCTDRYIVGSSDDGNVVIWRIRNDLVKTMFGGQRRRDLCDTYEYFAGSSSPAVTAACLAPPSMWASLREKQQSQAQSQGGAAAAAARPSSVNLGVRSSMSTLDAASEGGTPSPRLQTLVHQDSLGSEGGLALNSVPSAASFGTGSNLGTNTINNVLPASSGMERMGLGGSVVLAAGYDGVVGVFVNDW